MAKFYVPHGWTSLTDLLNTLPEGIEESYGSRVIKSLIVTEESSWYVRNSNKSKYGFSPKFVEKFSQRISEIAKVKLVSQSDSKELKSLPDEEIWTLYEEFLEFITKPITFEIISESEMSKLIEKNDLQFVYPDLFLTYAQKRYLHKDLIPLLRKLVRKNIPESSFKKFSGGKDRKAGTRKPDLDLYDRFPSK